MRGLMISAMASGQGKTLLTCGLLAALKGRGLELRAFKCGPDYIDPMFHRRVLGVPSRNLDLFLQGQEGVRSTLAAGQGDLALVEGAMGFFDGVGGTHRASAWDLARTAGLPVLLALRPQGASLTLAAQVRGLLSFRSPSPIAALVLTQCTPSRCGQLRPMLEGETGLPILGCFPPMEQARIPSRHLGLLTAGEISALEERMQAIGDTLRQTVDLDRLLELAAPLPPAPSPVSPPPPRCTIAVARDDAFSFYYQDSLDALVRAGARLVFFSPLADSSLPPAQGLYLGGGYPELYARVLSENRSMCQSVRAAVEGGVPTVAECGGFLYLQQALSDPQGDSFPMAGALPGEGYATSRLQRFGYLTLSAREDSLLLRAGEQLPAHEFHYWESTCPGEGLQAGKAWGKSWRCCFVSPTLYAGFPHLHFGGALPLARRFADAAQHYGKEHPL